MTQHSYRPVIRVVLFAVLSLATVPTALMSDSLADELRTWTDSTGKHKMEGKYIGMTGTKVKLELKNGKKMIVELKKFSDEDQQYIKSMDDDNPFKSTEDDPFDAADADDEAMESDGAGTITVDWSEAEPIVLEAPQEWKANVAPHPGFGVKPKSVALPPKKDFFESITGLAVNAAAHKAIVCYRLGREEKDSKLRLIMCDLQSGKTVGVAEAQTLMAPIALHDDGEQVLMRRDVFGHGNNDVLELWKVKGKKIQKVISWTPYDESWRPNRDVLWAEFIDADHLLTCSASSKVALWETATAKPLWYIESESGGNHCLSGDRKTLAYCDQQNVALFDIASRTVVGMVNLPEKMSFRSLAFSPSGKRLVCRCNPFGRQGDRIIVWDMTNGKTQYDFELAGVITGGGVGFPDENFVMLGDSYIIDLENQLKLWQYTGSEKMVHFGNLTMVALGRHNGPSALLSLELPHSAARDLLNKALTQPDLFVFREGVTVKLDVSGVPSAEQAHVGGVLTRKLAEMNCRVAENGTITLLAAVTGPTEKKRSFMHSGEYTVQEYLTKLSFVYKGIPAWETSNSNIPFMLSLKQGENIEGVLRKASEKADIRYYDGVTLPRFLQKPTAGQEATGLTTLGASQITPSGLK